MKRFREKKSGSATDHQKSLNSLGKYAKMAAPQAIQNKQIVCINQALRPPRSGASADRRIFLFSFRQSGGFLPKAATPVLPVVATALPQMLPL
jgi:hypothetical protein